MMRSSKKGSPMKGYPMKLHRFLIPALILASTSCTDTENPGEDNEQEVITTVVLKFTPVGGGDTLEFQWTDPENDGSPVIDPVVLQESIDYTLSVSFLNALEDPAEDITVEVKAESDQHQLFFTGTAVQSLATGTNADAVITQTYSDTDANGLPVGLESDIVTVGPGAGTFIVTLRHLPPENETAVKTEGLAEAVASGGFGGVPGTTDAQVTFELTVE